MNTTTTRALLPLLVLLAAAACSKKEIRSEDKPELATPASTLTVSQAAPETKVTAFVIDAHGATTIDMPAPKERIKAKTGTAGGTLDVDIMNLANTRGEVKIDLATLTTFTFNNKDKDEAQTEHARTWLEAVVDGKVKEEARWTVFAIRSIDELSATDLTKVASTHEGDEDIRTVTLTAHGDFLLHGRKSTKDAKLVAKFHYPAGALSSMSAPTSIDIKSAEPMRIVLAEHDVKPRDTVGKIAQGSFHLLGTKVAETAAVTIDVRATKK